MHDLYDYQALACETASRRFGEGITSLILASPCGSGKTTIIAETVKRAQARGRRVIVAAHMRRLVKQLSERLAGFGIPYGVIMADMPSESWAVKNNAPVQVVMKQTLFSRRHYDGIPPCDLFIPDECHHYDTDAYREVAALTRFKWLLGLTATPCNGDGSGLGRSTWQALETVTTIEALIERGRLCSVKTFGPLKLMDRRRKGQRTGRAGDPIQQWIEFASGYKTVVFASNRKESTKIRDEFLKAGIPAKHVDAHTPDAERDEVYADTAAGTNLVICSVGLLKEAVDIPELECCQLLTAAISPRIFWQGVGRIQRTSEGKRQPLLLDHSGATAVHGLPNTSPVWSLAADDSLQARERAKQESDSNCRPKLCKNCGAISAGSGKCPECGALLIHIVKADVETDRENLQEVQGQDWNNIEAPQRDWVRMLFIAAAKAWTCSQVSVMFKRKHGQWPAGAGVHPVHAFDQNKMLVRDVFPQFLRRSA